MSSTAKPISTRPASVGGSAAAGAEVAQCADRHLRFGWWSLLAFLVLGIGLETLHGFKVGLYLNASNETRRLMWTLAHAHGTLLGLVNIAFGVTVPLLPAWSKRSRGAASACLLAAGVVLPMGFFLGGVHLLGGDPGLGIFLVPLGAVLLFVAIFLTARALSAGRDRAKPNSGI